MRKIVTISAAAASLAVAAIAMPGSAEARFGAGIAADTAAVSGAQFSLSIITTAIGGRITTLRAITLRAIMRRATMRPAIIAITDSR